MFVAGPGHGGPGPNACAWLEGTYTELYSHLSDDAAGMAGFFRQFSFPGGVPSHCAPETPGSFHEGGELGYSLLHAVRGRARQPGPGGRSAWWATARPRPVRWRRAGTATKFLDPARDGAVLPILHLNEYKIANPTLLARIPSRAAADSDARVRLRAVRGGRRRPGRGAPGHGRRASTAAWTGDRRDPASGRPGAGRGTDGGHAWPMIVLRTPKGWTCPPVVDGQQVEGTFRAHQVPLPQARTDDEPPRRCSRRGCARTGPRSCSTTRAGRSPSSARSTRSGDRRMSANPVANGGAAPA